MADFLCLQRRLPSPAGGRPSPTDPQRMQAEFNAWRDRYGKNLPDPGGRLGKGKLLAHEAPRDGPFIEAKELIGGYMIVSADSLDEAAEIARACPGLVAPGSGVEVIEIHKP